MGDFWEPPDLESAWNKAHIKCFFSHHWLEQPIILPTIAFQQPIILSGRWACRGGGREEGQAGRGAKTEWRGDDLGTSCMPGTGIGALHRLTHLHRRTNSTPEQTCRVDTS